MHIIVCLNSDFTVFYGKTNWISETWQMYVVLVHDSIKILLQPWCKLLRLCSLRGLHEPTARNWHQNRIRLVSMNRALILLGLALYIPSASVSLVLMVLYRYQYFFCLHPSLYLLVSWAWWDWPLTWLTNHRRSVLWHCWLCHVTRVKPSPKWPIMCRVGR